MAVVIGVDPLPLLAPQAIVLTDQAEIVIKSRLLPNVRKQEGPFGELPKCYGVRVVREIKQVAIIDEDALEPLNMEWAVAARFQTDRDLSSDFRYFGLSTRAFHHRGCGSQREKLQDISAKMGLNATTLLQFQWLRFYSSTYFPDENTMALDKAPPIVDKQLLKHYIAP